MNDVVAIVLLGALLTSELVLFVYGVWHFCRYGYDRIESEGEDAGYTE